LIFEKPFPSVEEIRQRIEQRRKRNREQSRENIDKLIRERESNNNLFLFS